MLKNYILTSIRNLFRNWNYTLMNIIGLSIGLTAVIFISIFVFHELSYDKFHENKDNIYRANAFGKMMNNDFHMAVTCAPMWQAFINDYPEVTTATRVRAFGDWLMRYEDKKFNEKNVLFADSTFFDVFSFNLLRGDPDKVLSNPRSLIFTESTAKRYFGDEDPIGKMIRVENDSVLYEVVGLMEDIPENSHFHFDMLGSIMTYGASRSSAWLNHNFYTYILLEEGVDIEKFENKIQGMVTKYVGPQIEQVLGINLDQFKDKGNTFGYTLEKLTDIHLHSKLEYQIEPVGDITYVYIFIIVGIFIISIASINFINLSTARAAGRAKEVGIRKVLGGHKKMLAAQFLIEAVILTLFSLIIAILLVEALMPSYNNLLQLNLDINYFSEWYIIPSLIVLLLIVGLLSGSYPAFFLASFKPVQILKGNLKGGSKSGVLRYILVVTQLAISIIILIGTITVYKQLNLLMNKDMGFDKENVLVIERSDALRNNMESFKQEVNNLPDVLSVTNSSTIPGRNFSNNAFFLEGAPTSQTYLINQAWVSYDYGKTFGIELTEGRFFSRDISSDSSGIVISEMTAKSIGIEDPIGKRFYIPGDPVQYIPIIGVYKDFHFRSLHHSIEPTGFTLMPGVWEGLVSVKLTGDNTSKTIKEIQKIWESFNEYPFEYFFLEDELAQLYKSEQQTSKIFVFFSVLSLVIASLGLLGLISFISAQRKREIAIRKTFGSSTQNVVFILNKEIIKLVAISILVSVPLSYFFIKNWLTGFAYRIEMTGFLLLIVPLFVLILSLLIVSYHAFRAAIQNPAHVLRHE